ncbi:hypothetical protein [Endozoicomonas ascidiicola]|uniref:hypothetical protein n=1 Tax=Endozoicomonas ascidiicola TaxID=1698521 RepID=UPI000B21422B|nr:hypothetical protein [Endozoicomonas ascidiicola]
MKKLSQGRVIKLENCPCCRGKPMFADLMVSEERMWQVSCTECGLSSELDPDKHYTAMRWNQRLEKANLRMWITLLGALLPAAVVIFFLLGSLMGINLAS